MTSPSESVQRDVAVVIGVGGMGRAIARRLGSGRLIVLADLDNRAMATAADQLRAEGHEVLTHSTDVADRSSVTALARACATLGPVTQVVHTAGLSPAQAPTEAILHVDLLGVAYVLEEFGNVVARGGAGVVVASMAGHQYPVDDQQAYALGTMPTEQLLDLPFVQMDLPPSVAYAFSKRANLIRTGAASRAWGARGARINSISPGIIATPMGADELAGEHGDIMRTMINASAARRRGTPEDIADAAAFLLGPTASFVTGTDLLVDGGVTAALRVGALGVG